MCTLARVLPASNNVCVAERPAPQSSLGALNSEDTAELCQPTEGTSGINWIVGKYAARATPMRALAAAIERSAAATSGRRCNRSEGTPTGRAGNLPAVATGGMLNPGAGV